MPDFVALDLARQIDEEVDVVITKSRRRLLHEDQLRQAAHSVPSNIREAHGRRVGPERNQFLRYARASAEETDEHLRVNYRSTRLTPSVYWRLHNRLKVVVTMLTRLMGE